MKRFLGFAGVVGLGLTLAVFPSVKASALTINYNNVISDVIFDDVGTMNATQIDAFLNTFPNSCLSTNNGFSAPDPTGYSPSTKYTYGSLVSAGTVIYHAAQAYGINPQVLLATLQKEQGLVVGDGTNVVRDASRPGDCGALAISASVGYACSDKRDANGNIIMTNYSGITLYAYKGTPVTSVRTCVESASYVGFSRQVINAAWLFTFDRHRSEGQADWAVQKANWDNSDDLQFCYSGPMTQGTYRVCPSGSGAYYDGYYTIDNTAVHMDNGATAAFYHYTPHLHGQVLFFDAFTEWFGSTQSTDLVRTVDNATVYLISGSTKYPISSMSVLQNLSIFGEISYVPQSLLDGYTTGKLVGRTISGNGTVYFMNSGIKLAFTSCAQLTDYGLACGQEIDLTPFQLSKFYTGPNMTSLYSTTSGKNFYISGGQRHEIFDQKSLEQIGVSVGANVLPESGIDYLAYGAPVVRNGVIVTSRGDNSRFLYDTNRFMPLNNDMYDLKSLAGLSRGSLDALSIPQAQRTGLFNGFFQDGAAIKQYVLTDAGKVQLTSPTTWTNNYTILDSTTLGYIPAGADSVNNGVIKSSSSASVYYMVSGKKRPIPSWGDLIGLHATPFAISTIPDTALDSIPSGPLMYAPGRLVKDTTSATVYIVKGPTELFPITSFTFPSELGLDMSILTINNANLQTYTRPSLLQSRVVCADGKNYVGISGKLYEVTGANLTQYGFSQNDFINVGNLCSNTINSGKTLSAFIRVNNGTIYSVDNGQKHPITSYGAYLAHGGTSSNTLQVSDYFASLITTGSLITQ